MDSEEDEFDPDLLTDEDDDTEEPEEDLLGPDSGFHEIEPEGFTPEEEL
jgi:hypothetical protein